MSFPPDTQVWVKCDDGEWWPAKTREVSEGNRAFLGDKEDSFVEFYHDVGQLYPVCSTIGSAMQELHRDPARRASAEADRFERDVTRAAVVRAMEDTGALATPGPAPQPSSPRGGNGGRAPRAATGTQPSFAADQLRNVRELLAAISGTTAARLVPCLTSAGMALDSAELRRQDAHGRAARKRARAEMTAALQAPINNAIAAARPVLPSPSHAERWSSESDDADSAENRMPEGYNSTDGDSGAVEDGSEDEDDREGETGPDPSTKFVRAASRGVLEVLRTEVFENKDKLVLSPQYRFRDILGAVAVDNQSVHSTLPSLRAVREAPEGGFDGSRRVLLVPLTEDYDHNNGWMQPITLDGTMLAMRLAVNGTAVAVPPNWALTPGKEAAAIRSAPVADITELVMGSTGDLFTLELGFTSVPEDTELWCGVVACIFVEEVPLTTIADHILMNYRKFTRTVRGGGGDGRATAPSSQPRASPVRNITGAQEDGAVAATEVYVKVQCTLSTLPMEIPVRGSCCEHLQCMEMTSLLAYCMRTNLWNCPQCGASVKPRDVWVNHRLKDWIQDHRACLSRVEYVLETPSGKPLGVRYRRERAERATVVDIEDD